MSTEHEDELVGVIDELIDEYSTLREKLKEKRKCLQERDIDRIEVLNEEEASLTGQIEELNRRRHDLSLELSDGDLPEDRQISLDEVKNYITSISVEQIEDRRRKLKSIIRDVQRINEENVVLLENRMRVFDRVFDVIEGESDGDTYDRELEKDDSNESSGPMFINEAV